MKSFLPYLAIAALSASNLTAAPGDKSKATGSSSKEDSQKPTVGLLFEWIELDHRSANKLIRKHANKISTNELREVLEKLLDEEKASLAETAYFVAKDLKRAKVESVDEHIYPTEYDPPGDLAAFAAATGKGKNNKQ